MPNDEPMPAGDRDARRRAWMVRAQAGDQQAYRRLLEDVRDGLGGFLGRRLADPDDVADVLQETLLAVHRARHTYDPARPFGPWLLAIARHALVDHVRRASRRGAREVSEDLLPRHAMAAEAEGSPDLGAALARLPPAQREAFEMLKLDGLSVRVAAERAGTTPGALKVRAHRAYKALQALLGRGGR
jgi:RNA polymerase sigma-70 factor (ECF subfamily)